LFLKKTHPNPETPMPVGSVCAIAGMLSPLEVQAFGMAQAKAVAAIVLISGEKE
jgi:hypothetical protein